MNFLCKLCLKLKTEILNEGALRMKKLKYRECHFFAGIRNKIQVV